MTEGGSGEDTDPPYRRRKERVEEERVELVSVEDAFTSIRWPPGN